MILVSFHDISDVPKMNLADAPLAQKCDLSKIPPLASDLDKPLAILCENYRNCPLENGEWTSERGDSKWVPAADYVPQKQNLDGLTWKEILHKYDINGIDFKEGDPDFKEISKGTVQIEGFSTSRSDNFDKADIALAKQHNCSSEEVSQWRKDNGYTWHECKDMRTMQKVPHIVHNNVAHAGGIAEAKKARGSAE